MWGRHLISIALSLVIFINANAYQNISDILSEPTFDLDGFVLNLNNSDEPNSLESTLRDLKKQQPIFFKNYVLMYKSRSLQTSSFLYPRVLLSSTHSTTVITYNGHPEDHGYEKLEVMRFDVESLKFKFNEISFQDGKISLSHDNPQKCMNCHQNSSRRDNDPRPNWEPYSIWPGAYSSSSVGATELSDPMSSKYDPILAKDASLENQMYQLFLDTIIPNHPRYSLLTPMIQNKLGDYFPAIGVSKSAVNLFTTTFTDQLVNLNALRLARLIKESPIVEDYKKVVLALVQCEKIYLPDHVSVWHKKHYPDLNFEDLKMEDLGDAIEFIFEPYDVSTQDWSMDFGTGGRFAFRHRFGGPNLFRQTLRVALETVMPELKGFTCQSLESELKAANFFKSQVLRNQQDLKWPQSDVVPLISRCISCHTSESFGAPYIPFDNKNQLRSALKTQGYPRGSLKDEILYRTGPHAQFFERMPADGYLPKQQELETFTLYINSL